MRRSNIVINTLAFLDELKNGVKQADLLRSINSLGISRIEIRREFIKDFEAELLEIKNISQELKMELYYSVPKYLYIDGCLAIDKIEEYFYEADRMGCRNIKLNIGEYHDLTSKDAFLLNSLCERYLIKLTIENDQTEDNGRINKISDFLQLSKKLGMNIGCTFDVGNWLWQQEDPKKNANILRPFVTYIHLKDVSIKDGPQAVFLDEGVIPWRSILGEFNKDIPVGIEYPCFPNTLVRLKKEIEKLINLN